MDNYLLALGWWNFLGSLTMIGFFSEEFGKKMLNDWTKIFSTEFKLDYWSRFWLGWAIGLNIFYGVVNIAAVKWAQIELKQLIIGLDLLSYSSFFLLAIWGVKAKRTGSGIYSVFLIFGGWIVWGIMAIM